MPPASPRDALADRLQEILRTDAARVLLSTAILASVLPFPMVERLSLAFFLLFALELSARGIVFACDLRHRRLSRAEVLFLACDLLATISFLPLESLWGDASVLRLLRVARLGMLIGYWGPLVRELWLILSKRERRYQIAFVAISVVILAFTSALLLHHFAVVPPDFDQDGRIGGEHFWDVLWWSFRQLESADNLLAQPSLTLAFGLSVLLTVLGLTILSFMVGIGTSVVEELVDVSKERRLGARRHTVLCNVGPHSAVLLQDLVTYYAKSLRSPRIVTMGQAPRRFHYMFEAPLRAIRYRHGRALSAHDLLRVDADRATRIILLGNPARNTSDAEVISQVLSARRVNPDCPIHAELAFGANVPALLRAGGHHTVPLTARGFVARVLTSLALQPELEGPVLELLSTQGDELYTCVYGAGAMRRVGPPDEPLPAPRDLCAAALARHRVILLGYLRARPDEPAGFEHVFFSALDPAAPLGPAAEIGLCGFLGIAASFEVLRRCCVTLRRGPLPATPPVTAPPSLTPENRHARPRHIMICGFHDGIETVVEEIARRGAAERITVLVPPQVSVERTRQAILDRARRRPDSSLTISTPAPGEIAWAIGGEPKGSVTVATGDGGAGRLLHARDERLAEVDLLLLTWTEGEEDPDARTSVTLLNLTLLEGEGQRRPRVVCEVRDDEKAALFRERFAGWGSGIAVVGGETLRSSILAQGVFVPGIFPIYKELLGVRGASLRWMVPTALHTGEFTFAGLHASLLDHDRRLLLGVQIEGRAGVVLNPGPADAESRFPAAALRGALVVEGSP